MPEVPAYIKKRQEKSKEATSSIAASAKRLRELKDEKETLSARETEVNKEIDELSLKLAEDMETHGVDKFTVEGVGTVFIQIKNRPNVVDKPACFAWFDEHQMGDMAPRGVHHARLESLVKEMLERGELLPQWLNNFQQKRAVIRRK